MHSLVLLSSNGDVVPVAVLESQLDSIPESTVADTHCVAFLAGEHNNDSIGIEPLDELS